MSFNNFQQEDNREANNLDARNHSKRLFEELTAVIKFFDDEDQNMMLHIVHIKKLDVSSIKNFIKEL